MVHQNIVNEITHAMTARQILDCANRNGEYPFGFIIDYIKDMYLLPKSEGWDTAMAVCRYFGFK